ncbi:Ceramide synthase 1 [Physocladia obscura]|uniref:Ceramide synthase 1 n=1 Tax=Physocladia obscura TaxID=109957 RepID=A0AAD5X8S4_9FUNG|nr:Ceramide synthase 1 [Physocladia obscura]
MVGLQNFNFSENPVLGFVQLLIFDTPAHRLALLSDGAPDVPMMIPMITTPNNSSSSGSIYMHMSSLINYSPLNKDLVLPEDLYAAAAWVLVWAALHFVVMRNIIKPLSEYLIPDPLSPSSLLVRSIKSAPSTTTTTVGSTTTDETDDSVSSLSPPSPTSSNATTTRAIKKPRNRKRNKHNTPPSTPPSSKQHPSNGLQNSRHNQAQIHDVQQNSATLGIKNGDKSVAEAALRDRTKLQLSMWKFLVYVITVSVGVCTLIHEDWWMTPRLQMMKIYYNVGFGNYMYQLLTIFMEPRQSDFVQMLGHHVCTVAVMAVSYFASFTRIGAVILLLHDLADPIMMADIFFAIFALTFLVTRNFIFPYYVISACIPYGVYEDGERMPRGYAHYFWVSVGCLWVLQFLNLNWGFLIFKMVVKAVQSGGKVDGDIRDEDEE